MSVIDQIQEDPREPITIELAFEGNRTLEEYANDLADLFDANLTDIKLVFKGKILNFKSTA